jgi:hypothetical protein
LVWARQRFKHCWIIGWAFQSINCLQQTKTRRTGSCGGFNLSLMFDWFAHRQTSETTNWAYFIVEVRRGPYFIASTHIWRIAMPRSKIKNLSWAPSKSDKWMTIVVPHWDYISHTKPFWRPEYQIIGATMCPSKRMSTSASQRYGALQCTCDMLSCWKYSL